MNPPPHLLSASRRIGVGVKKTIHTIIIAFMVCALALAAGPVDVQAFPPLPASFYGTVKLNGANVADGTLIEALINGKVYAQGYTQMFQGDSVYTITIPGDDTGTSSIEGGKEGETITFKIGGIEAQQSAVWRTGSSAELNLSAAAAVAPNTPAPTPTPYPTQTAIPKVNTPLPTYTPVATQTQPVGAAATATPPAPATVEAPAPAADATVATNLASPAAVLTTQQVPSTSQPTAGEPGAADGPKKIPAEKTPGNWIIFMGAGIFIALVLAAWLFIRQLNR